MRAPQASPGSAEPAIEARGISRFYGDFEALRDFVLTVPPGSVYGLLGPNGSGKSTFLALLASASPPASGTLRVFGQEIGPWLRKEMGVVFQEGTLDPLATLGENLGLSARLFGMTRSDAKERIEARLAHVGLAGAAGRGADELSGGMRRRAELARALLHDPRLLVLDEPTAGVDPRERKAIWDLLRRFAADGGTVLLATNDMAEADDVCTHATFLAGGQVLLAGPADDLRAGLRAESALFDWDATGDTVAALGRLPGAGVVSAKDGRVMVVTDDAARLVPEAFRIANGGIRSVSIRRATLEDAYFQVLAREPRSVEAAT